MDPVGGLVFAVGLIMLALMVHYLKSQVASGNFGRNSAIGIRTKATMSSDAAWDAGHSAAAPMLTVAYLTAYAAGVITAAMVLALKLSDVDKPVFIVVPLCGMGLVIALVSAAAGKANSAARAAGGS
jgi:uncharacterized membrane protein